MSLKDRLDKDLQKAADDVRRMNRINYYKEELRRIYSQWKGPANLHPISQKNNKPGQQKIALAQALLKEMLANGQTVEDFEKVMSSITGSNYHAGAMAAMHSDDSDYYAALEEIDATTDEVLEHHGILGMKWGIRRYQNPDGSLTALGRKHLADGKTQRAIEKWEQKKGSALARGDVEFAKKNMDYLSNQELQAFKERISARTSLDDLKQASRKITADKLQTWANMAQSGANLLNNGINAYNSAAKIVNSITGKKTIPVLKDLDDNNKEKQSIMEIFENGKLVKKQTQYTDKEGNKRDTTENWKTEEKRPETIKNTYDETGRLQTNIRTYTDSNGNTVTDTRKYDTSEKKANPDNPYSKEYESRLNSQYNYNYKTYRNTAEPAYKGPTLGLPGPKNTKTESKNDTKVYSGTVEGKGTSEGSHTGFTKTNAERAQTAQDAKYRNAEPVSNSKDSWSSYGKSSSESTGGFKGFKNNMSDKERDVIKDLDDYTDDLFGRNKK